MSKVDFDPEQPFSKREFGGAARSDPPTVIVRFKRKLKPYEDGAE